MRPLLARERRAQVEVPVVMIFAVVTGVLVLLVVGWFAIQQNHVAETTRNLKMLSSITTTIEAAGSTYNAQQNVTLMEELRFECEDGNLVMWYGDENRPLPGVILFAPPKIKGIAMISSYSLGSAYRIGNIVYIEDATTSKKEISATTNPSYTKNGLLEVGTLTFTPTTGPTETRYYFDPLILEGSRVSGNVKLYDCGVNEIIKRYRFINTIQRERVGKIVSEYQAIEGSSPVCRDRYDTEWFNDIETALTDSGKTKTADQISEQDTENLVGAEAEIRKMNEMLVRESCATAS